MLACFVAVMMLAGMPHQSAGVPASPLPVRLQQPDGTEITLRVRGDEFYNWHEDMEGYTVVIDGGWYVYANLGADGRLAPTGLVVGKANPKQAALPVRVLPARQVINQARVKLSTFSPPAGSPPKRVAPNGTVRNLVVLCKFSDHTFGTHTRPESDYDTLFNAIGGSPALAPTGSVKDYFLECSYGVLTLNSTVLAWVTLPQTEAFYANSQNGLSLGYPRNAQGMVEDALKAADAIVNFGQFDMDNDGYVDAIDIIHSGFAAETGGGGGNWIWSHRWALFQLPGGQFTSSDLNANGVAVKVFDYHTEAALWGTSGTAILRVGVIAHETGHFFGLPDLYDTDGTSEGIGSYCLMANSWGFDGTQLHPPHMSAWCKAQLGWVTPTVITPGNYTAQQAETTPQAFRINIGYPSQEYLLIENRQPVGFENVMPQGGLVIWHIDDTKPGNDDEGFPGQAGWPANNRHYRVALLQADGRYDLERGFNRGDAGDVYHGGGVSLLGPGTVPNTDAYQGGNVAATGNTISGISTAGAGMSFTFGNGTGAALPSVSINDVSVFEGDPPSTAQAVFTLTLSASPFSQPVSILATATDGTATLADNDYVPASALFTWAVGDTNLTRQLVVTVNGDTNAESNETFAVVLSNPQNVNVAKSQGNGTIVDDDGGGGKDLIVIPDTNPTALINQLNPAGTNSGLIVRSVTLQGHTLGSGASSGLYKLVGPEPHTYSLTQPGIVLSSGNVRDYESGPNTSSGFTTSYGVPATALQETLLDPITGGSFDHNDVTQLDIIFDAAPTATDVTFLTVFGSDEFPEWVGSPFIDGFGIFLNGTNIAFAVGAPININHPDMQPLAGTELDGVLAPNGNPVLQFVAPISPGSTNNRLTFIIADTSDDLLDTTIYLSSFQAVVIPLAPEIPVITSVSPPAANVGGIVTITGQNFHPVFASNHVHFGSVQAKVIAATPTELRVVVPAGAKPAPLTVEIGGRVASANIPFVVTFDSTHVLSGNSFGSRQDFSSGGDSRDGAVADFNGDGQPDLAVANFSKNTVSIYRNTIAPGGITTGAFTPKTDLDCAAGPVALATGDLDGDGKLDLAVAAYNGRRISLFRNTTTATDITFAPVQELVTGNNPRSIAIGDLDGDGRNELVVAVEGDAKVSVYRSVGLIGALGPSTYAGAADFIAGTRPIAVEIGDIDGDGRRDIVAANGFNGVGGNSITILRNLATPGVIDATSFAPRFNFATGLGPIGLALADLDLDGKLDVVVANSGNSSVSVFRNNATPGVIDAGTFDARLDFSSGSSIRALAVADMDGDGRPDIAVSNHQLGTVSVLQNRSAGGFDGNAFTARIPVATAQNVFGLASGDLDMDGKVELISANTDGTVTLLKNLMKSSPAIAWPTPADIVYGTRLGSTQLNATSGAGVSGSFIYLPPAGTLLPSGNGQTLKVVFVPFDTSSYELVTNTVSINVLRRQLVVQPDNKTRAYGASNPPLTGVVTGVQTNDAITVNYQTAATTNSPVIPSGYPITFTISDPGNRLTNYTVIANTGTLLITQAVLSVTAHNAVRAYGDSNPVFTGTINGAVNGDVITATFASAATPASSVGGYPILPDSLSGGALTNYSVITNQGLLTITNVPLVAVANNASRPFGEANPPFTGSLTGIRNGDNISANYGSAANASSPVGTYPITISFVDPDARLNNYTPFTTNGTLTVTAGDPPVVTLNAGALNYTENDPPTLLDAGATVTDGASADFDGGQLSVSFTANGEASDRLAIRNQGGGAGEIGVTNGVVSFGGTAIGAFTGGGSSSAPLVVSFNANATPAAAQALVQNLTYENVSENPSTAARTLTFQLTDGDGGTNAPVQKTIHVTAVNDPPAVSITSPLDNAKLKAPGPLTIQASATDVDGAISQVEFFQGVTSLGVVNAPPFTLVLNNVAIGDYTYSARATDNSNATADSAAVAVSVNPAVTGATVTSGNQFQIEIMGVDGVTYDVQVSTDLVNWTTIGQVTAGPGATPFLDTTLAGSVGQRFYRFVPQGRI